MTFSVKWSKLLKLTPAWSCESVWASQGDAPWGFVPTSRPRAGAPTARCCVPGRIAFTACPPSVGRAASSDPAACSRTGCRTPAPRCQSDGSSGRAPRAQRCVAATAPCRVPSFGRLALEGGHLPRRRRGGLAPFAVAEGREPPVGEDGLIAYPAGAAKTMEGTAQLRPPPDALTSLRPCLGANAAGSTQ